MRNVFPQECLAHRDEKVLKQYSDYQVDSSI